MYSGEKIAAPVAERTRNIQDWGVLTSWQKTISGPMTYAHLAKQWAPTSKAYAGDIKTIAERFLAGPCNEADPRPELVAEARGQSGAATANATPAATDAVTPPVKGTDLARKALEEARAEGNSTRAALGGPAPAKAGAAPASVGTVVGPPPPSGPPLTILNASPGPAPEAGKVETASLSGAALKDAGKPEKKAAKCRVWTASYGGAKAIIIKAVNDQTTNYTVLDVNEGSEKREADAYIDAYAKGGERVGEFANQTQALDKAFELCPEG
jgi:hypothetical protein